MANTVANNRPLDDMLDPKWPVNYPWVASRLAQQHGLQSTDKGRVTSVPNSTGQIHVARIGSISMDVVNVQGIEIGNRHKYGDLATSQGSPLVLAPRLEVPSSNENYTSLGRFRRAVMCLTDEVSQKMNTLPPMDAETRGYLTTSGARRDLCREIVDGIQAGGLLDVFNKPNFTPNDILRSARIVTATNPADKTLGGVYCRILRQFKELKSSNPIGLPEMIVGETHSFREREP